MQVQKENIRKNILKVARKEFFKKGFKGTSMRTVARKAEVGLSNMYNYFKNKDDILAEVLRPLMEEIERISGEHNNAECINVNIFTSRKYQLDTITVYMSLITRFRKELNLLLFHAHGSRYENFRDDYTNRQTKAGSAFLHAMGKKYPSINTDISEFFMHTVSSSWLSILGEIVSHNIKTKEIEKFLADYMAFGTAGWKKLMNV